MNIEIGTKVWIGDRDVPLTVVNIKIDPCTGKEPMVYFDDGGDMPSSSVYYKARAWE